MATKKAADEGVQINIPPIDLQRAQFTIMGTAPLVTNKFSEKAKRMMLNKQMKTAQTSGKAAKNPVDDFIQSLHWISPMPTEYNDEASAIAAFEKAVAEGAQFGFPAVGLKESIVAASYRVGITKNKVSVYASFHIDGELIPITGVTPIMREDAVRLATGVADIRFRAEFPVGWKMTFDITYDSSMTNVAQLAAFIQRGGFSCGIGEHRVEKGGQWGSYTVC